MPSRCRSSKRRQETLSDEEDLDKSIQWLESFYDEDTPTGANARCVGSLLDGVELICELEPGEAVDHKLTHLEFRRVMGWLGVYSACPGEIGELACNAAKNLSGLAVSADPWGNTGPEAH